METVIQLSHDDYEQLQRDAARTCGPHTCSRSRRWKIIAAFALVVMVGMKLDKLYREDARNAALKADIEAMLAGFVQSLPSLVQAALPPLVDRTDERRLMADLTSLRDGLRHQAWAHTPAEERDLDLLRRLEALERQ